MRRLTLFLLTIFLSGCGVGIGFVGPRDVAYSSETGLYLDSDNVGNVNDHRVGWVDLRKKYETPPYLKRNVIELWGEPVEKKKTGSNQEQWKYKNKLSVERGIIIGLGFPIPLVWNISNNFTTLLFSDENLVKANSVEEEFTFCGWFMSDESSKTGCH